MARQNNDPDYDEPDWEHPEHQRARMANRDPYWYGVNHGPEEPSKGFKVKFSNTELTQLGFTTFVMTLVFGIGFYTSWETQFDIHYNFFSMIGGNVDFPILGIYLLVALVAVGSAFILHEMGHKVVAQRFGCWAEFRYNLKMLLITAAISLVASFFIIVPGAVYIRGHLTKKQNGIVSLAGPATNLALAILFLPVFIIMLFAFPGNRIAWDIGFLGPFINCFLGAFNMVPLGNLDGGKILKWNPIIWAVMMVVLAGPVIAYFLLAFGIIG